jgi:hypothetical protein
MMALTAQSDSMAVFKSAEVVLEYDNPLLLLPGRWLSTAVFISNLHLLSGVGRLRKVTKRARESIAHH